MKLEPIKRYGIFNHYGYLINDYETETEADKACDWENGYYVSEFYM